jgi:hypothetical protein
MGKDTASKQQFWTPDDKASQGSKMDKPDQQMKNELDDLEDAGLEFANA